MGSQQRELGFLSTSNSRWLARLLPCGPFVVNHNGNAIREIIVDQRHPSTSAFFVQPQPKIPRAVLGKILYKKHSAKLSIWVPNVLACLTPNQVINFP
jgi:hypothetical protein